MSDRVPLKTDEHDDTLSGPLADARTQFRLLAAVLDQLPVGVVVAEAPSGRILAANRYARELAGGRIAASGVDGYTAPFAAADGRPLEPFENPLARAVLHGEEVNDERLELAAPGREPRIVSANATPIHDESGAVVAAVALFEDVSERERRERAEREFVTNAAHELRTPLAAIAGAIEVLQAGAKEQPDERDLFLDHIERESARLTRLGRALLLLARVQSSSERPRLEVVALRPLLQDVAASARQSPRVQVRTRCERHLAVLANRDLVEQAIVNLAGNAARYTREGTITLSARAAGDRVVIEVRDTGPGIHPDVAGHLFERFERSGEHDSEGFGLGLSIAKQAVEATGGTLELDSEVGRGTKATVRLPLARLVEG